MAKADAENVTQLILEIRGCFQDLKELANTMHEDIGVPASHRAILEYLSRNGANTVADIARAKNVSRQHVQKVADLLVDGNLAHYLDNPAHKRSKLLDMTPHGSMIFSEMAAKEKEPLNRLAQLLEPADVQITIDGLSVFRTSLRDL